MDTDEALISRWLEPNPNRGGGANWWVKGRGVSVWAIIGNWKTPGQDVESTAKVYVIPTEAVEAALAYYRQHQVFIDDRLAANDG